MKKFLNTLTLISKEIERLQRMIDGFPRFCDLSIKDNMIRNKRELQQAHVFLNEFEA